MNGTPTPEPTIDITDAAQTWASLSETHKQKIGTMAIAYAMARHASDNHLGNRRAKTAEYETANLMLRTTTCYAPEIKSGPEHITVPDLTKLGIQTCRVCGCTNNCACQIVCHWIDHDLCSNCDPAPTTTHT